MARQIVTETVLTDDIDGSPTAETVAFSFDRTAYEIDLNKSNRKAFDKAMALYVSHAGKVRALAHDQCGPASSRSARCHADCASSRVHDRDRGAPSQPASCYGRGRHDLGTEEWRERLDASKRPCHLNASRHSVYESPTPRPLGVNPRPRRCTLDKLLTVPEAADRLNTSERFIRRMINERRIQFIHVGRHVRISESVLDAFVIAGVVEPVLLRRATGR